jgi:hypothetical protein
MPFNVARNGMRMYTPSWQNVPGSAMKAANRATSNNYFSKFSSLGANLIDAGVSQSASMMQITTQMVTDRLHSEYAKKMEARAAELESSLDLSV